MVKRIKKIIIGILIVVMGLPQVQLTEATSKIQETKNIYYVDSQNGDDRNSGQSEKEAWKTFQNVNSMEFRGGDQILLKSGGIWNEALKPKGSGDAGNPIIIDKYGKGAKPIINGNGTSGANIYVPTGAVELYEQEYWEIRNLEVTNYENGENYKLEDYKKDGTAERCGILVWSSRQDYNYKHIVIENCYVHDVQSRLQSITSNTGALKATGGIIVLGHIRNQQGNYVLDNPKEQNGTAGFDEVIIRNNYVERVALEGIRTKCQSEKRDNTFTKQFHNVCIEENYLSDIAGDGIVLSEVKSGGIIRGNVCNRACNADYGTKNFAGIWSMTSDNVIAEYNEAYGQTYSYNDCEGYDIDLYCMNNIYQYNYSHHNNGGFFLFMGANDGSVVRYNISANDGTGTIGTGVDGNGTSYHYNHQSIFHFANNQTTHQIYNNVFYIGDGVKTSLFGSTNNKAVVRSVGSFKNNILYKEGNEKISLSSSYSATGADSKEGTLGGNPEQWIQNNCFYPKEAFVNSGLTEEKLIQGNNIFENPKLVNPKEVSAQENTSYNPHTDDVVAITSRDLLRNRAEIFKIAEDSPCIEAGQKIPNAPDKDFFGNDIIGKVDIGAYEISDEAEKIESVEDIIVNTYAGVYPKLPETVLVTYKDRKQENYTREQAVLWDFIDEKKLGQEGTILVKGELEEAEYTVFATVRITGELPKEEIDKVLPAVQNAYIQKSRDYTAYSNKKGTISDTKDLAWFDKKELGGNYILRIKNSNNASYNRRTLLQFDLSSLSQKERKQIMEAKIKLTMVRCDAYMDAKRERKLWVYADEKTGWNQNTVTWKNAPDPKKMKTVIDGVKIKSSDIRENGDVLELDVLDYIRNTNADIVNFYIAIMDSTGYDPDNSGFDFLSKEGAEKLGREKEAPQLYLSTNYPVSVEPVIQKVMVGEEPELPNTIYVKYSNGIRKPVVTNWEEITSDKYNREGSFVVKGSSYYVAMPIRANIEVVPSNIKELNAYK